MNQRIFSGLRYGAALALLLMATPAAFAGNSYPIVLVHGFTGWGPGEMGGRHYWGGGENLVDVLAQRDIKSYEAVVGPLSSNWDRACELYAYIKGGQVDYGAAHAARHGHERYGRRFQGLAPDWGEPGERARVHLVGHSQGGQTIRVLTSLLARGDKAERENAAGEDLHPLFQGGKSWVHSVTTLSTPHDGSTLATILAGEAGYLLSWILALGSFVGDGDENTDHFYDFKLDQWNIRRGEQESGESYRERVLESGIWDQPDIAVWDLNPVGARLLNSKFQAVESVYYFSWGTLDSKSLGPGRFHIPGIGMNITLFTPSLEIGRYSNASPGEGLPAFDSSWWPNDGVVNTLSMSGPRSGSLDHIINVEEGGINGPLQPGIWHFMGVLRGWDHLDIIGHQTRLDYHEFYFSMAQLLAALPPGKNAD